jgi:hypothetical protein
MKKCLRCGKPLDWYSADGYCFGCFNAGLKKVNFQEWKKNFYDYLKLRKKWSTK